MKFKSFECGKCGEEYLKISDVIRCCVPKRMLNNVERDRKKIKDRFEQDEIKKRLSEIEMEYDELKGKLDNKI